MNDAPGQKKAELPQIIRNVKPRLWPKLVMRLSLLCAGLSCLLAIFATNTGVPQNLVFLVIAPAVLGTVVSVTFAIALLIHQPIDKLLIGDVLETWPDKTRYQLRDIAQIEFVSGPEEDYAEDVSANRFRDVRIALRARLRFFPIRLTMSGTDAARLSEWATRHAIRLIGADRVRS